MLKDIVAPKVENIAIAIIKEKNELDETVWNVYILNMQNKILESTLVSSKGYGETVNGEKIKTSMLRHLIGDIPPNSYAKIEPIIEEVFGLHNEYWVSYFQNNKMYDKKYVFLAETIKEENFVTIPLINKKGVLLK
jgi:hypothetical protein